MYNFDLEFEKSVKLNLIKEFIETNNRVPSSGEINDLVFDLYQNLKSIRSTGLIRSIDSMTIDKESSVSDFNSKLKDYYFNAKFLFAEIEDFYKKLTERAFYTNSSLSSLEKRYRNLNSFATSLLLAKGINSNLLYSVTENFSSTSKIVQEETDANVSVSGCSIGNSTSELLTVISNVSYSVYSNAGYLSAETSSNIESILTNDGDFWTLDVLTTYKQGSLSVSIEMALDALVDVSTITVNLASYVNSYISCYVAGEDKNYSLIFNSGLDSNSFLINVNSNIAYVKFLLTKQSADSITSSNNYIYSFKIDSIELNSSTAETSSTLVCGPYQFTDAIGDIVPFSFVQLAACEQKTENSWIEYYLSSDSQSWIPVDASLTGGSVVNFQANDQLSNLDIVNSNILFSHLDYENVAGLDLEPEESYLNQIVDISYLNKISPNNILFKRNIKNTSNVFDISSGWFFDSDEGLYSTSFEVISEEGTTLDLGSSTAYIDGVVVTGTVLVSLGFHIFKTDQRNWADIEEGLLTESDLRNSDPLYPYNHKYILSGYTYNSGFIGNKYYNGVSGNFGKLLRYVSKSEFKNSVDLDIYSIDTDEDNIYFIVNTLKGYDDWKNEEFSIEITIPSDEVSTIYLKAVINSNDNVSSTVLKNFTLRAG